MSNTTSSQITNESMVDDHTLYSSTIHKILSTTIAVLIGLLQITPTDAPGFLKDTLSCFLVFGLIYVVLIVCEMKLRRNQTLFTYYFFGHLSHFFGVLAVNILVFLLFPVLALVLALFYLVWFVFVMYRLFGEDMFKNSDQSGPASSPDQDSPV
ncbi:unnamed protein product [Cochlearia groenlandica]